MPEFTTLSVQEARMRTIPGRQGKFINEYAAYIQQLPPGQAVKLRSVENENPTTIRRRLTQAAHALGTKLIIKRSGSDIYFWSEDMGAEEPRPRNGRRRRNQAETTTNGVDET
jgi:hypothetical protein